MNSRRDFLKIGIVGHLGHSHSCLHQAIANKLANIGVEVEFASISTEEAERESSVFIIDNKPEPMILSPIEPESVTFFKTPQTRRERREKAMRAK